MDAALLKPLRTLRLAAALLLLPAAFAPAGRADPAEDHWPGPAWDRESPEQAGLSLPALEAAARYAGGRGCVVRHGYLVFSWGDIARRADVASSSKTVLSFFLFKALETGRIPSLDARADRYEPRLDSLNPRLGYKDREITLRELANQMSCYGVSERPGTAFDYNDYQIALFWDVLFTRIYGATYATVDRQVLHPLLTDPLQCQDDPTLMAFGIGNRPGRMAISPRDYARFGLLYLRGGRWRGQRLLSAADARRAVSDPVPADLPRTRGVPAEMIPGQRTLGSTVTPDDEYDHAGSYSWNWWLNGVDRQGRRFWPGVPADAYAGLGHENGLRGLAVLPSLDLVVSWNDTLFGQLPEGAHPAGEFLRLIADAAKPKTASTP